MKGQGVERITMEPCLFEVYASLDRGWRACLLAATIVVGTLVVTAL